MDYKFITHLVEMMNLNNTTLSKASMVCNLEQVPPKIRIKLYVEAKKSLFNERKRQQQQQQQQDSKKRPYIQAPWIQTKFSDRDKNSFHTPNQYAKVKKNC
jgi:hypothetical protein